MYPVILTFHSILRWLVLLAALLAIIRAINGLSFKRGWTQQDNQVGLWYTILFDVQLLLGIILYFISPITTAAMQNFGGAMGNAATRYFSVEHVSLMVIALIVAHVGRAMVRRAPTPAQKHRRTIIWFGIALVLTLAAIPWPFLGAVGRPLFRFFGL